MLIGQQELKKRIREIRGKQSQKDFAERFNVSRQAVDRWEKGTATPSAKVLRELQIEKVFLVGDETTETQDKTL